MRGVILLLDPVPLSKLEELHQAAEAILGPDGVLDGRLADAFNVPFALRSGDEATRGALQRTPATGELDVRVLLVDVAAGGDLSEGLRAEARRLQEAHLR